ncbi:signal peptidase I [Candidatus Epulonipiscium fishelsonii]|uniref:Signal peptidase I n=1 Tax=Candidatus Epulonipiscium fishelsonii TaxID=77094 RepID=A0ACC8XEB8_9FIRM|nr:signal peptidase I [Epulopiscium sp. SCG-B11WGA-EpuloA1]ONI43812.1 signal peptidase I [Epulopiscium sp. SCG-B05WGA-EpuloA1]
MNISLNTKNKVFSKQKYMQVTIDKKSFFRLKRKYLLIFSMLLFLVFGGNEAFKQYQTFLIYVPTLSMYPTIEADDKFAVTKISFTDKIQRGDIITFNSIEFDKHFVKRAIGLPGETVNIIEGQIYIDGVAIIEDYIVNNDYTYSGEFVVPKNSYFVMGDNRQISNDSRFFEDTFINIKDITGIVYGEVNQLNEIIPLEDIVYSSVLLAYEI